MFSSIWSEVIDFLVYMWYFMSKIATKLVSSNGEIELKYRKTLDQVADIFTTVPSPTKFETLRSMIGVLQKLDQGGVLK